MTIEAVKNNVNNQQNSNQDRHKINTTLQGVLVNSHLRIPQGEKYTFDDIQDSLLITNSEKYYSNKDAENSKKESVFDFFTERKWIIIKLYVE